MKHAAGRRQSAYCRRSPTSIKLHRRLLRPSGPAFPIIGFRPICDAMFHSPNRPEIIGSPLLVSAALKCWDRQLSGIPAILSIPEVDLDGFPPTRVATENLGISGFACVRGGYSGTPVAVAVGGFHRVVAI